MAHYVFLGNFTDQGVRGIRDTTTRAKALRKLAAGLGVTIQDIYWTLGQYDVVLTMEAPQGDAVATLAMKVASFGNLRLQTLRAFNESEVGGLIAKL